MNPITSILFEKAGLDYQFARDRVCEALEEFGVQFTSLGPCLRFEYVDEERLACLMSFQPEGTICSVSLSVWLPGDEKGWAAWSEENERRRMQHQKTWLSKRGYSVATTGTFKISNDFSPKDGSSAIRITNCQHANS